MLFINKIPAYLPCILEDSYSKKALYFNKRFLNAEKFKMSQIVGVQVWMHLYTESTRCKHVNSNILIMVSWSFSDNVSS